MSGKKKQPKETDEIRALLEAYGNLQRKIDLMENRRAFLEDSLAAPSSSNLSGMPGGSRDRTSKQERDYLKIEELEERIDRLCAEENERREEISDMIELMDNPDEQNIIQMRYFDRARWKEISATIYGDAEDYDEELERYLKRTFRLHGHALQTLARIYSGRMAAGE